MLGLQDRLESRYQKSGFRGLITSSVDVAARSVLPNNALNRISKQYVTNIVTRSQLRNHKDIDQYKEFSRGETVCISEPVTLREVPPEISAHVGEYDIGQPFVCSMEDVILFGAKAMALDDDHNIILETSDSRADLIARTFRQKPVDFLVYHTSKQFQDQNYGTVVSLLGYYNSYHHWIFNQLTKLEAIETYENSTGVKCNLLIPSDPPSYITESLRYFGYKEDRWIEWDTRHARAEKLVIPSVRRIENKSTNSGDMTKMDRKIISARVCNWLQQSAKNKTSDSGDNEDSKKVLISRDDVGRRTIKNKEEIYDYLLSQGFEEYRLGDMRFSQQVQLFSQADAVIGVHGAGLTNLVFSEDANVVEIFGDNIKKPTYFLLSKALNHNYGCIVGEQSGESRENDIYVELEEINQILEKL